MGSAALTAVVRDAYEPSEYPALAAQQAAWSRGRSLVGVRIVDATPVFRNTLTKHLALLAAGAELTVAALPDIPHDPDVVALLRDAGLPVITAASQATDLDADVVCDCAGLLAGLRPRCGAVELTRSGVAEYQAASGPVVIVDDSVLKQIETTLGTGDGFVRAMRQLGHGEFAGRSVVVFGAGKVGCGVALASTAAGASVTLVDPEPRTPVPPSCASVRADDSAAVARVIAEAWCVVAATGAAGALAPHAAELVAGGALLANMGVADEYGPDVPPDRVLGGKVPVNFVLDEPTRLRYLDPVFALSNAAALRLLRGKAPVGVSAPSAADERRILACVLTGGALAPELRRCMPHLVPAGN